MPTLAELVRSDPPLWTAGAAVYPWKAHLEQRYVFTSRFGDEVLLHRVEGPFIHLPRALCPVGPDDRRDDGEHVVFEKCPTPRDYQADLFKQVANAMASKANGVIVAFTGFGKTVVGYYAAYLLQRKTLVITTKDDIYKQWIEGAQLFLGLAPHEVGEIRGDKCEVIGTKFVVAMIHSLSKDDKYPDWITKDFGLVIFDECHRLPAEQFSTVADRFPAKVRLGLSATPTRSDGKEQLLFAHIGPIIASTSTQLMVPKVLRFRTGWQCPRVYVTDKETGERKLTILPHDAGRTTRVEKSLAADPDRNKLIAKLISEAHSKGRKLVLFSTLHDHLNAVQRLCIKEHKISGKEIGFYVGATTRAEKERRDKEKEKPVILTTYAMCSEGTSIDTLDTCIIGIPRANVEQAIGRIRRVVENKKQPVVMDLIDADSPILLNYANARLKFYDKIGCEVKDMNS
jgi:superfamily II DNA or RNA helicase